MTDLTLIKSGIPSGELLIDDVVLREMRESDRLYVYNSWVKSFGDSTFAQTMPKGVFRAGHSRLVEILVPRCSVLIACFASDEDTILGWAATEHECVHYVYVRSRARRHGLARKLVSPYLEIAAQYSHPCTSIRVPSNWAFNPYAMLGVHHAAAAG